MLGKNSNFLKDKIRTVAEDREQGGDQIFKN